MKVTTYEQIQVDRSAVALGKFQGLHRGHMLLLDETARLKDEGLTAIAFTINMKSDRVLYLPEERFSILDKAGIDVAVECEFNKNFAETSPLDFVRDILVKRLHAAYVVVGEDFRFGFNREGTVDRLMEYGLKYGFRVIHFNKLTDGGDEISSSLVRRLVASGNLERAGRLMGRDYSVAGTVREGKRLGRTLGFPTVNLYPPEAKLLYPCGVYETYLFLDGRRYPCVTNIGDNPTTDGDGRTRVETHIIGYDGDLYGQYITVFFKRFIRPEKKFNNLDELRIQLEIDRTSVLHQ